MSGVLAAMTGAGASLKVTAAPNPTVGFGTTTGFATATVDNARFPVTYLWQFQGGDDLAATNFTNPSTQFTGNPPSGEVYVCSYNCTVVDATGRTATSNNISVRLTGL